MDMGNGSTRMVGEGKGGELHACGAACGGNTRWWGRGGNRKIKKIWILRRDNSENAKNERRREKQRSDRGNEKASIQGIGTL